MKPATKQWKKVTDEDYDDSLYLFKGARHPNAVYHMCQALEKLLKAAQVELKNKIPKKTHHLASIAQDCGIEFTEKQRIALEDFSKHYQRVRYPDYQRTYYNTKTKVAPLIKEGKELYLWISKQLTNQ